jgi:hypothetical protein
MPVPTHRTPAPDRLSGDQPFVVRPKVGDLVTVPYTSHTKDIASSTFVDRNLALKYELINSGANGTRPECECSMVFKKTRSH